MGRINGGDDAQDAARFDGREIVKMGGGDRMGEILTVQILIEFIQQFIGAGRNGPGHITPGGQAVAGRELRAGRQVILKQQVVGHGQVILTRFYPLQKLAIGDIRRNFKDVKALHGLCQRRQQRPNPGVPISGDLAPGQMFRPGNGAIIPALDNPPGRIGPGIGKLRLGVRFSVQRLILPQHNITQPGRERR